MSGSGSNITIAGRTFSVMSDGFISDNDFDFDAGLKVSGDFVGDQKRQYTEMIAERLNESARRASDPYINTNAHLEAQLSVLREQLEGPAGFPTWKDAAVSERVRRVAAEKQLAEREATIEQMRDVLWVASEHSALHFGSKYSITETARAAAALPNDNTALLARLAQERARCAELCESNAAGWRYGDVEKGPCLTPFDMECEGRHDGMTYAAAIRAMGDQQ